MSLTDLEIRQYTKPIEAELDRQKEKAAAFKKERDELKELNAIQDVQLESWGAVAQEQRDRADLAESALGAEKHLNFLLTRALKSWVDVMDHLSQDPDDPAVVIRNQYHGKRLAMSRAALEGKDIE